MRRTADRGQRIDIARISGQKRRLVANRRQHFIGFLEEDFQQLGIDLLVTGLRKFDRFGRGCRRSGFGLDKRRNGRCNLWPECVSGFNGIEYSLGLVAQFRIGQKPGVFLQGLQIVPKFVANPAIVGGLPERIEQYPGFLLVLFDLCFDGGWRQLLRFCQTGNRGLFGPQTAGEGIEIGFAMLQRVDEEAQQ